MFLQQNVGKKTSQLSPIMIHKSNHQHAYLQRHEFSNQKISSVNKFSLSLSFFHVASCIFSIREAILVRSKVFPSNYLLFPTFSSMAKYPFDQSSKEDFLLNYFVIYVYWSELLDNSRQKEWNTKLFAIWDHIYIYDHGRSKKLPQRSSHSLTLHLKNLSSVV